MDNKLFKTVILGALLFLVWTVDEIREYNYNRITQLQKEIIEINIKLEGVNYEKRR